MLEITDKKDDFSLVFFLFMFLIFSSADRLLAMKLLTGVVVVEFTIGRPKTKRHWPVCFFDAHSGKAIH